ncbi:MAG: rod shape-determining protein MreD [Flavobacteriaceae bacterium CG_4_8_14_3_um_filter_34_10]|nr:MAG: rod shape-determining protein MreD [Flavobacteriaceae bacterium CG2_30_34_30]PIQ16924.1 MAG: rod shape-determining protein MreD [Flavobacteriaceae bacterium CG18_big_fil_WC_8_21_14_2_50_34_36]PIX10680.1 MAG: rod shape-determining protein MreD [Flavobacteriaceae bacterium CG_4_8_14_3_um_filter_34_10]PJC06317.1 MAG: rod shape-determining protein MreD [Flavobacteriaceae bacterium CG_4_9_14_0_8_um_filter_34_30]
MSSSILLHGTRFLVLLLAQVFLFNNIDFLGFINPYVYILFILLYPVNSNQLLFLLVSFFLGLSIDIFSDSGGIHAASCIVIAFLRPSILKFSFGVSYEYNNVKVSNTPFGSRLTYFFLLVIIHHLVLFNLEVFNMSHTLFVLKLTLFSSIFTTLVCMIFMILFSKKKP